MRLGAGFPSWEGMQVDLKIDSGSRALVRTLLGSLLTLLSEVQN